jgi:hypothetical protein
MFQLIAQLQAVRRAERSYLRVRMRMMREEKRTIKNITMLDSQGTQKDHLTENIQQKTSYQFSTGFSLSFLHQMWKDCNS